MIPFNELRIFLELASFESLSFSQFDWQFLKEAINRCKKM